MRPSRVLLPSIAVGSALLLAACSGGGGSSKSASPTTSGQPSPGVAASPSVSPSTTAAAAGGTDASCLEGKWALDMTSLEDIMETAMAGLGEGVAPDITFSGSSAATMHDGSMTTTYDNQKISIAMSIGGKDMVTAVTMSGTTTGAYTVDGDQFRVGKVDGSGLKTTTATTIDGEKIDMPSTPMDTSTIGVAGAATFSCSPTVLTLTTEIPKTTVSEAKSFTQKLKRLG